MLKVLSLRCSDLRNFSGETVYRFDSSKQFVVILGPNGAGKTTLLEALSYVCHLKSFRTSHSADLVSFNQSNFFIEVMLCNDEQREEHTLSVGCDGDRKLVKCDGKSVKTHKDILQHYRVLGVTEDDLDLIRGAPQLRRTFLHQTQMLFDLGFVERMRAYRRSLHQRNALLFSLKGSSLSSLNKQQLQVWTKNVWDISCSEIHLFNDLLERMNLKVNELLLQHCSADNLKVDVRYVPVFVRAGEDFDSFWKRYQEEVLPQELAQGRSLWGLHLDDLVIDLTERSMRRFASRGQQKLAILLLKIAVLHLLGRGSSIFIVDDFMTDFDANRIQQVMQVLSESLSQIFITTPLQMSFFKEFEDNIQFLELGKVTGRAIG